MKKIKSTDLLEQLMADVRRIMVGIHELQQTDPGLLLTQPAEGKWSAVQAIEHLNTYGRYYLPAIEKVLEENKPATEWYSAGWLGDYFTRLMMPKDNKVVNKMQSPKNHRPQADLDPQPVLQEFLVQQQSLLHLLERAKGKNIGALRVPISLSTMIRLKLGDTFRFLIAHEQRHMLQAQRALEVAHSTALAI